MSTGIDFAQLDALEGELLPERALLSTVVDVAWATHVTVGGTTIAYACSYQWSSGSGGLIGALGLGSPASVSMSCVPSAIVAR